MALLQLQKSCTLARKRRRANQMRHAAGRQRQCQGSSHHVVDGRVRWVDLSQCRRMRKTCATCLTPACAHDADCHCPLSSLCCLFLICAASTQGRYSDDSAWHKIARWPCFNPKVVHASSQRKASPSDAARCRPPAPVPGQFSITPTLRATWARCLSAWRGPAI